MLCIHLNDLPMSLDGVVTFMSIGSLVPVCILMLKAADNVVDKHTESITVSVFVTFS